LTLDQFRPPPIDEAIGKTINQPLRVIFTSSAEGSMPMISLTVVP
jgi:hypothetical protein